MDSPIGDQWRSPRSSFRPPETPLEPMKFLSRTWSPAAQEISKAVATSPRPSPPQMRISKTRSGSDVTLVPDDNDVAEGNGGVVSGTKFSFASSETSLIVMERILSQSVSTQSPNDFVSSNLRPEISSPRTSGRLSHSCSSISGSPPVSPSDIDDFKQFYRVNHTIGAHFRSPPGAAAAGGSKTVGRWLKDRREKKREEARAHNAQLHVAVSVAGVAAAVAAIAAATAAAQSNSGEDEQKTKTDMAVASAATLVAAQCVEAAEALGVDREHLTAVVSSAVNVRSAGDIMTLTAAAATALRGAATLKARALKEVWNIAAVIPVDKGTAIGGGGGGGADGGLYGSYGGGRNIVPEDNFLGICSRKLLARGCELLKRTRKGDLHWKIVSVYINRMNQVMLKMKSKHVAGTITKKKKYVVVEVLKDMPAWSCRELINVEENMRYFGLKTTERGVIEFECRGQREYDLWTQGVSRLLSIASEKNRCIRHRY